MLRPPRSTRTYALIPCPTRFRSRSRGWRGATGFERVGGQSVGRRGCAATAGWIDQGLALLAAFLRGAARLAVFFVALRAFFAGAAFAVLRVAFFALGAALAAFLRAGDPPWRRSSVVSSSTRSLRSLRSSRPGTPSLVRARWTPSSNTFSTRSQVRSYERRVGNEGVCTCYTRWSQNN